MPSCEISDCAQMSKTIIAVRHFGLGGRESLETAVKCGDWFTGLVILSYAPACLHPCTSLNNEKHCRGISEHKIAVCEKTAGLKPRLHEQFLCGNFYMTTIIISLLKPIFGVESKNICCIIHTSNRICH